MNVPADARLYTYRCETCRIYLTANTRAFPGSPYRCRCYAPMRFQWSEPVVTDEQRAAWLRGQTWGNPDVTGQVTRPVACDVCPTQVPPDDVIRIPGVGQFCSEACAEVGRTKIAEIQQRVAALYEEIPWLKKTS